MSEPVILDTEISFTLEPDEGGKWAWVYVDMPGQKREKVSHGSKYVCVDAVYSEVSGNLTGWKLKGNYFADLHEAAGFVADWLSGIAFDAMCNLQVKGIVDHE